jgi:S1-C subfamily serine protease
VVAAIDCKADRNLEDDQGGFKVSRGASKGRAEADTTIAEAFSLASAQIVADPAFAVPVGGLIEWEPLTIRANESPVGLQRLKNWGAFEGVLLALIARDDGRDEVIGSAVIVAPGIAIAARHVIDHVIHGLQNGTTHLLCFGVTSHCAELWRIHKVTCLAKADLAILGLVRASKLPKEPLRLAAITTRMPKIGDRLLVTGFRADGGVQRIADRRFLVQGNVLVSQGTVTQRFIDGRDQSMLPSSCVEVNCDSVGGMSGGPVFDESGQLIGVLSSSVSSGAGFSPSFVSLIWPVLVTRFEGGWPSGLFQGVTSLLDLGSGLRFIDNDRCLGKTTTSDGEPAFFYDWWE